MTLAIIFDSVGAGEWFLLLAVILVVVGPKRLPSTVRKFGNYYSKFRRAADSFKRQLMDMENEINSVVRDAEKEVESAVSIPEDTETPQGADAYDRNFDGNDYPGGDYMEEDYYGMNDSVSSEDVAAEENPVVATEENPDVANTSVNNGDKETTAES
jgi:Sec-independent protein translocase protein TatA